MWLRGSSSLWLSTFLLCLMNTIFTQDVSISEESLDFSNKSATSILQTNLPVDYKTGLFDPMQEQELGDLLSVQTIFTATDQAPKFIYANCPYSSQWNRIGTSNITPYGIKKMYLLGRFIEKTYRPFLESVYSKNIIAASGDTRAEEETNLAFLAGCCKPTREDIWSYMDGLFPFWWQPIGVARLEYLNYHSSCPKVQRIEKTPEMLKEVREHLVENSEFITRILPYIGQKTNRNESLLYRTAWIAEGMITEQKMYGSRWSPPNWIQYAGENGLQKFKNLWKMLIKSSEYYPFTYYQIKLAPLFKIIVGNMIDASNHKTSDISKRKFYSFTTNQYIMHMLMQTLNLYNEIPSKASGIVIEIRKHHFYEEPLIYLYYAGYSESPRLSPINIGNCTPFKKFCSLKFCPLNAFINSLAIFLQASDDLCENFNMKLKEESINVEWN